MQRALSRLLNQIQTALAIRDSSYRVPGPGWQQVIAMTTRSMVVPGTNEIEPTDLEMWRGCQTWVTSMKKGAAPGARTWRAGRSSR